MNSDTIFHPLTNGEQFIQKFQHHLCCSGTKFIAILTTHRLLTRTKKTTFCCCHYSSYSAISLESIHRIDEYRAGFNMLLYSILCVFWLLAAIGGIITTIFLTENESNIRIIGIIVSIIPLAIMIIIIFSSLCCCSKQKFIELQGTFGSTRILFEKNEARLFENNLSEQISQSKLRLQQTSIPTISPSAPHHYLNNETWAKDRQMATSAQF
jgi:hypothetical protein